jgi:hypothetical protein
VKPAFLTLLALVFGASVAHAEPPTRSKKQRKVPVSLMDVTVKTDAGIEKKMSDYKGRVLLIVNTASR